MKKSNSKSVGGNTLVPSLFKVILAYVVDWYIVALLSTFPVYILRHIHLKEISLVNRTSDLPEAYMIIAMVCAIIITFLYFAFLPLKLSKKRQIGQTLGKRLFKIKTVRTDGEDITWKESINRNLYILILEGSIFPSFLYIKEILARLTSIDVHTFIMVYTAIVFVSLCIRFFNTQRQTGHDLFSKTKVVNCT